MGRFHRHDDGTVHTHEHEHHQHGDHTGYQTGPARIEVLEEIFAENDVRADLNRRAFETNGIRALNLMSSPGRVRRQCCKPPSTSSPASSPSG